MDLSGLHVREREGILPVWFPPLEVEAGKGVWTYPPVACKERNMAWDDLYTDEVWRAWSERPPLPLTLDWIAGLRKKGAKRVYDMGCGLGRHTVLLAREGFEAVASDISPRAREETRRKLEETGLEADVIDADMTSIPFPDEHFDAVLSIGVMEHNTLAGIEKTVAEIRRVLGPGGEILASFVPRHGWISHDDPKTDTVEDNTLRSFGPEEETHHFVNEAELRELFGDFEILSIEPQREQGMNIVSVELYVQVRKDRR